MSPQKAKTLRQLGIEFFNTREEKSYVDLHNAIRPNLVNYVNNIVNDSDATEDIVSVALTKVYNKIDQYDPMYNISTWIYRIAYNDALIYLKKKKSSKTDSFSSFNNYENDSSINKILSTISVENSFITSEESREASNMIKNKYDRVIGLIENLSSKYSSIILDRFKDDMSYAEISVKHNMHPYTVATRIRRGKEKIVKMYNQEKS